MKMERKNELDPLYLIPVSSWSNLVVEVITTDWKFTDGKHQTIEKGASVRIHSK
jgi:hypothetical protein